MIKVIGFILVVMNQGSNSPIVRYDELTTYKGRYTFSDRDSCVDAAKALMEAGAGYPFRLACLPVIDKE